MTSTGTRLLHFMAVIRAVRGTNAESVGRDLSGESILQQGKYDEAAWIDHIEIIATYMGCVSSRR